MGYSCYKCIETENKKNIDTHQKIIKLMKIYGIFEETDIISPIIDVFHKIKYKMFYCMKVVQSSDFNIELSGHEQDQLAEFVIYLDDIQLFNKIFTSDSHYVILKYKYNHILKKNTKMWKYLEDINEKKTKEKENINKIICSNDDHISGLNNGFLKGDYIREENVFGMTPEDNIYSKLLLMYNKIFNKKENLSDKDLTTLKNLRLSLSNIKRTDLCKFVDKDYFYSIKLHKLFFNNEVDK